MVLLLLLGAIGDRWRASRVAPVSLAGGMAPAALPVASPAVVSPAAPPPPGPAHAIDLNRATPHELDALPGIGPVLAERIAEHRRLHGPFRSPDELLAVRGIGPRLLEKLRPLVRVGAADAAR